MSTDVVELVIESEQAMQRLAAVMAKHSGPDLVIFLSGNLGTGKTTFAQGFIRELGFDGIVKSPTYTLVEPYDLDDEKKCYHFDLYRLSEGEELEFTGARDYFDTDSICLVEWPEKAGAYLPEPDISCAFKMHDKGREVRLVANSEKGKPVMLQVIADASL